jgi:hypothetical protein
MYCVATMLKFVLHDDCGNVAMARSHDRLSSWVRTEHNFSITSVF